MKINSNITAYTTNNHYLQNEKRLTNSTAKLSSGFKLNKAGDDPANFAIANRMRMQLKGMEKVKTNATTGASVVETAESALSEISDMIQRMNELAVKSANGTMSDSDRQTIQYEIDKLKEEVTRISQVTEFNDMPLLDGTFENKGYCENRTDVKIEGYSDATRAGVYKIKLDYTAVPAMDTYSMVGDTEEIFGVMEPKVSDLKYDELSDSYSLVLTATREDGVEVRWDSGSFTADQVKAASDGRLKLHGKTTIGGVEKDTELDIQFRLNYQYKVDALYEPTTDEKDKGIKNATELLGKLKDPQDYHSSTYTVRDPENPNDPAKGTDYVTFTSRNGTEVTFEIRDREQLKADGGEIQIDLTGEGTMRLQVGTEEGQVLPVSIPEMSLTKMHLEDMDLSTQKNARQAIDKLTYAMEYVNDARSKLGAYQNRLENTITYIDSSNESLTSSYSRIRDTDMAEEMTEYTNLQVLTQAGMSMLAQANEFPQQALQLLQ